MLKETMCKLNMNQTEFAKKLEVTQSFLSQMLSGKKKIPVNIINKCKELCGENVSVTYSLPANKYLKDCIELLIEKSEKVDESLYNLLCKHCN